MNDPDNYCWHRFDEAAERLVTSLKCDSNGARLTSRQQVVAQEAASLVLGWVYHFAKYGSAVFIQTRWRSVLRARKAKRASPAQLHWQAMMRVVLAECKNKRVQAVEQPHVVLHPVSMR